MITHVVRGIRFLIENSLFLLIGAVVAMIWANMAPQEYEHFIHSKIFTVNGFTMTLHFFVNDILMAIFFALAGKEVWEAMLPGGVLSNIKSAATPLIATVGGMAGPALLYLAGTHFLGKTKELGNGWAIPCATDIAFSYMVARLVFGPKHPAIPFLLLLAIADDALGLVVLAIFYPTGEVVPVYLVLSVVAVLTGVLMRKFRVKSFWLYLIIPGILSWVGFMKAGIHPALGLLPIVPTLPHAHSDMGLFDAEESQHHDTLNEFANWWKNPVQLILGTFSLLNAGVVMSTVGDPTWLVAAALIIGKPIGIFLCGGIAAKGLKFGLPTGMYYRDLIVLGFAAGIGFTVALFVAGVAFGPGEIQSAAKMGALASFGACVTTFISAKILRVKRVF
jgi:NhaA family Na+:H+ antiporter